MALALGLDVGNAKVKLCAGRPNEAPRWVSVTLPYDARRPYARQADFDAGIPRAIEALVQGEHVACAVAVTSAGYAYPTFDESVVHIAELLRRCLPNADTRLLSFDGETVSTERVLRGDTLLRGPLAFTNPMGAVVLARANDALGSPPWGLVLDTGGSTTGTVILAGEVNDPVALRDRAAYTYHRVQHGKLAWVGVQTTPLEALAHEVSVGGRSLPVVPRGVPFENVAVLLDLLPKAHAKKLGFFGLLPSKDDARRALADSIGLDRTFVSDEAIDVLARELHHRAIDVLARALSRVLETAPEAARRRAVCFGLGARSLAKPALERAGVSDVVLAEDLMAAELAVVASCYGAFVAARSILNGVVEATEAP